MQSFPISWRRSLQSKMAATSSAKPAGVYRRRRSSTAPAVSTAASPMFATLEARTGGDGCTRNTAALSQSAGLRSRAPVRARGNAWFGVADGSAAFFAGIWVAQWTSMRKLKDGETTDDLYGFLATEPNAEVAANHPKAMPVILKTPCEYQAWMSLPWARGQGAPTTGAGW